MANRTHLYVTNASSTLNEDGVPADALVVAGANWRLPILWCSVFESAEISTIVIVEDGERIVWPVAVSPLHLARQRAYERKSLFLRVFPAELEPVYDEWLATLTALERTGSSHLYLDTSDICDMCDEATFLAVLTACIRAFAEERPEDWIILFEHTQVPF